MSFAVALARAGAMGRDQFSAMALSTSPATISPAAGVTHPVSVINPSGDLPRSFMFRQRAHRPAAPAGKVGALPKHVLGDLPASLEWPRPDGLGRRKIVIERSYPRL